ncbi:MULTISPECIES: hypothetical protein [unclassified Pseudomonas]|uniref:hypothetical protein n=1 Tax=Pseudomonas TaxID=286 RepID=UPI001CF9D15F|nr:MULTISPECIES: hypothetical protein [unclassified Pseudomonas]MCP1463359.1 hypothetical protein [Pseudomonas sp. S3E17]UCZ85712.1 hypothetical protein LGQ10_05245 [Pseudomonas sp. L5B5]
MLKLKDWLHWVWPTLIPLSPTQQAEDVEWKQGIAASVQAGDWSTDSDVVLDESRRLFDAEVDRRKGADAKAGIYLAAITALIPVLVSLLPALWSDKSSKWLGCIGLVLFGLAVAFLLRAGAWAFRTLKVAGFAQLGPGELANTWKESSPKAGLAKQLARAVLHNYSLVNEKVTGIKMTHEYLLRAFLTFTILLVLQVMWPFGAWVVEKSARLIEAPVPVPLIMCYS